MPTDAALALCRALGLHSRGSLAFALFDLGSTSAGSHAAHTDAALALRRTVGPLSISWLAFALLDLGSTSAASLAELTHAAIALRCTLSARSALAGSTSPSSASRLDLSWLACYAH